MLILFYFFIIHIHDLLYVLLKGTTENVENVSARKYGETSEADLQPPSPKKKW